MLDRLLGNSKAWKAVASFVGTFLTILTTQFWVSPDEALTVWDLVITAGLSLGAGGLTFVVPNPNRKNVNA